MAYVCEQLTVQNNVATCAVWVEQITINDLLGITMAQAVVISASIALVIITGAVFRKLSKIGESSHG
ncbi:hypothetical protein SAMN05421749_10247 [Acinetobacter marinus]|uniref:Uncharacterized protein n=1 Tax=Acinetobacter marinus TaxID=281375 RepID=A0A1G6HAY7_9GAMM|nr:hypothetical protein SAMN05421749_10247 [Acinetobacter marinus]